MKYNSDCSAGAKRNTRQKETVRTVFSQMCNHPTAQMVYDEVAKHDPSIGRATVYRILNALVENGTAIKVPVYDGADRFDITTMPHAHAKCKMCGAVCDIVLDGTLPQIKDGNGFDIEWGTVLYYGCCSDCKTNTQQNLNA